MRSIYFPLFAGFFVLCGSLFAQTDMFTVGGKQICVPPIKGFQVPVQKNTVLENLLNRPPNRLIVYYNPANSYPGIMLYAAVVRQIEDRDMNQSDFIAYKQTISKSFDQILQKAKPQMDQMLSDTSQELSKKTQTQVEIKAESMQNMGVFNQTDNSICTTQLQGMGVNQNGANIKNEKVAVSMCSVVINGRLINLYVTIPYKGETELKWSQQAVLSWRDAIMVANGNKTFAEYALPPIESSHK
jgi:hypothetical protein